LFRVLKLNSMKSINIVSSSNNLYSNYLIAMMNSAVQNTPDTQINFFIIYEDLSSDKQKLITKTFSKNKNVSIEYIKMDKDLFKNVILKTYAASSYEAYARLLLPELFDKLDKIIYLDADMIILNNLNLLEDIDLESHPIAAVTDINDNSVKIFEYLFKLKNVKGYFNSGVLVMNLKKLRDENFTQESLNFISKTDVSYKFFDQDILNYFFHNRYLKLDYRWNVQLYEELASTKYWHTTMNEFEYKLTKISPFIIHYTIVKPDKRNYFFRYRNVYKLYLKNAGIEFKYRKTSLKEIAWTLTEILFFKTINLLNRKNRQFILNFLRKYL